jgi:hypothetical protein
MTVLSDADRELVEALDFLEAAEPSFNEVTACLVWPDEIPDGLSRDGYQIIRSLLIARGYLHRGVPVDEWDFGVPARWEAWNDVLLSGLRWNGFRRLALTAAQRAELRRHLAVDEMA